MGAFVYTVHFSRSVMSDSLRLHGLQHARLFLSITNSQSLLKLMSIESVMPSKHLILCHPLLLPPIFPSIRVFSNHQVAKVLELQLQYHSVSVSFSFGIIPFNEYSELISLGLTGLISLQSKDSQESSSTP